MANGSTNNTTASSDTVSYGVTPQGFIVKPFQAILQDAYARAQLLFGPDIDLRSSSTVRKLLELASLEDALSWMQLDDVYNSAFVATAAGQALDRLGTDLGLDRNYVPASGTVSFKLASTAPANCVFTMPPGTLVDTAPPGPGLDPIRFRLTAKVSLVLHNPPDGSEQTQATVNAVLPGPDGNIAQKTLVGIDPDFAARYLGFDPSLVTVTNPAPFTGGDGYEDDGSYRSRLYSLPRSLWTADAVRQTVLAVDGVRDVLVNDPYGGLDSAAAPFGEFCFNDRDFQTSRALCNPYFFTITVAPEPGVLWESSGNLVGLSDPDFRGDSADPSRFRFFRHSRSRTSVQIAARVQLTLTAGRFDAGSGARGGKHQSRRVHLVRCGWETRCTVRTGASVFWWKTPTCGERAGSASAPLSARGSGEIVCGAPARFGNDTDIAAIEGGCGQDITLAPTEVAVFAAGSNAGSLCLMEVTFLLVGS